MCIGPTGVLIQQHHYQAVPASEEKLTSGTFGVNINNTAVDSSRWVYQTQLFKINLGINNISNSCSFSTVLEQTRMLKGDLGR